MGIYENTHWAHLTFETHSVIWTVTSWSSHCTCIQSMVWLCTPVPWCILTCAYQRTSFLASDRFWRGHLIMKTQVKTSTTRVSVGQKWPNHDTSVEWKYTSSISWTNLCSGDFKRPAFSPFWCMSSHLFSTSCCSGKPSIAARDVIWIVRGNSIFIGRNASARVTAKPSTIRWFISFHQSIIDNDGNGKFGH